jgi:SAM-dependent methyltransferase
MVKPVSKLMICCLALLLASIAVQAAETTLNVYQQLFPNQDGIGKVYMGREISHVMGHQGAEWLEREEPRREERTDPLIERLPVRPNSAVADIGSGTGLFSFAIAKRVPAGKVLAVDIQPEMLPFIEEKKQGNRFTNVEPVLGTITDPNLPKNSVDLIFIVDAYHEFSHSRETGEAMFAALKPGSKIVLIEYRAEDAHVPIKRLHKMSEAQAKKEMAALGLRWVETGAFLPQQHFLVFAKP